MPKILPVNIRIVAQEKAMFSWKLALHCLEPSLWRDFILILILGGLCVFDCLGAILQLCKL